MPVQASTFKTHKRYLFGVNHEGEGGDNAVELLAISMTTVDGLRFSSDDTFASLTSSCAIRLILI